jgi:hypothetical protein
VLDNDGAQVCDGWQPVTSLSTDPAAAGEESETNSSKPMQMRMGTVRRLQEPVSPLTINPSKSSVRTPRIGQSNLPTVGHEAGLGQKAQAARNRTVTDSRAVGGNKGEIPRRL